MYVLLSWMYYKQKNHCVAKINTYRWVTYMVVCCSTKEFLKWNKFLKKLNYESGD